MSQKQWSDVDRYFCDLLGTADPLLEASLAAAEAAGLPAIHVSPAQGKLLHLLARSHAARNILELGTLAGYSTIWLARALPAGGRLISLEADAKHAAVARDNIARAGLAEIVEIRLGAALDTLPQLANDGSAPFDFIFIDADKPNYPQYLSWSLRLARRGTVIVADNVVRNGAVVDADSQDEKVQGTRRFNQQLAREPRVSATVIQTVGSKGYDGFAYALVVADA